MIVSELMALLEDCEPDMEVRIMQPTGNHWRQIKTPLAANIEVRKVKYSGYLSEFQLDQEDGDDEDSIDAVVIGG